MQREPKVFLEDIVEAASKIVWDVSTNKIPNLREQIVEILSR